MPRESRRLPFFIGVAFVYGATSLWTTLLLWQILAITHSGVWVVIAAAATTLPAIMVGLTGPEWGIRIRMGGWLWGIGLLLAALSPWLIHSVWALLLVALLEGWVNARVIPMAQAWLMSATTPANAPVASTNFEMASRIGMVAGPLVAGGLLTALGALTATVAAGVLFLVGGWAWRHVSWLHPPHTPSRRTAAWRAVKQDGFLVTALAIRGGANLLWPAFTVAIPLLIRHPWHAHALGYGGVRTLWGVSTVLGTWLVIPRLLSRLKISYFLSWTLTGASFWEIGHAGHFTTALIWVMVGALTSPIVHVALDSHIGTALDHALQGGVFAIQRLVMAVVNLLGLFLITGALHRFRPGGMLAAAGLTMSAMSLLGLLVWIMVQRHHKAHTVLMDVSKR